MAMEERLNIIYRKIEELIEKYEIERVAVEGLYFAKNAKSAIKVAEVIGVIRVCAASNAVKVKEYTPLQIKMALTGYGRAEKFQVEAMVKSLLGREKSISPSHAADAAAVGLTDIMSCDFQSKR
jgi:crossover junction endodeoxyribonuclease RuvC